MSGGWFAVKRGITQHPVFKGHPERLAIWLWLIDNACWKDTPHDIRGKTVIVPRGSVCASERRIAEEVGVGRQVVRTFLGRLKTEFMINPSPTHGRNIISICNYEKYQSPPDTANPTHNPDLTQDQPTKEQENNLSGSNEPDAAGLRTRLWDYGANTLGVKRSLLGKWVSEHGEAEVMAALLASDGKADRVSWIAARLKRSNRREVSTDEYLARQGIRDVTDDERNFSRGGDTGPPPLRHAANDVPGVQPDAEEEARSVPECDVQAGRGGLALLALRA